MIDCGCDEILLPQGADGVNGKNAYTVTTLQFTQVAAGSPVTITVSDVSQSTNQWAIPGQVIRVTDNIGRGGWYQVTSIVGTTQIIATNLDYQPGSSSSGTPIAAGAGVSPAGLQGPAGSNGDQGGQGETGPANVLSIPAGNVTTLPPGSPATATISGSAPNQTLALGIPAGLPGASGRTLKFQANNSTTVSNVTTTYTAVVPSSTIDATNELCPNDGDAFKATFFCRAFSTAIGLHNGFNIQIQLGYNAGAGVVNTNVEYIGTTEPTFEQAVNMLAMPLFSNASSPGSPRATFKFEMIVHRIASTTARCSVEWSSNSGFNQKNGLFSVDLPYDFASTTTKQLQVNMASAINGESSSVQRWSLLVEKITV